MLREFLKENLQLEGVRAVGTGAPTGSREWNGRGERAGVHGGLGSVWNALDRPGGHQ